MPLLADESAHVQALLTYGLSTPVDVEDDRPAVIPRFGTVSPWASKVMEITRHCALPQIHRIKYGVEFIITRKKDLIRSLISAARHPDSATRTAVVEHLYSRMTGMIINTHEAGYGLFNILLAKILCFVGITGG